MKSINILFISLITIIPIHLSSQALNTHGTGNKADHTGGYTWIGHLDGPYLSLDPNEIQARNNQDAGNLFLNYWGGHVDLLGAQNPTGNLRVDGDGIFYNNSSDFVGLGTTDPMSRLHLADGHIRLDGGQDRFVRFNSGQILEGQVGQGPNNTLEITNFTSAPINFITNINHQALQLGFDGRAHFQGPANDGTIAAVKIESPFANSTLKMLIDGHKIDSDHWIGLNYHSKADIRMRNASDRADVNMKHTNSSGADAGFSIQNEGGGNKHWTLFVNNSNGYLELWGNGAQRGEFDAMGAYSDVSDRRAKTNIHDMPPLLEKVMRLKPKTYQFKSDDTGRIYIGFVAQEIEKLFPEVVNKGGTNKAKDDYYTLNYGAIGPIAIQAIKEQQEMIETLKTQVAQMASRIDQLEAKAELTAPNE